MDTPRKVVIVGYPAAELLDIACVTSALTIANWLAGHQVYATQVATPGGRSIECASGLTLKAHVSLQRVNGPLDTVIVSGGIGHLDAAANPVIVAHVRRLARESDRVASVCTGAAVLAEAGLLDGLRATTHWFQASELAEQYPKVCFDPSPIFIRDGKVSTSAGVTSALDLTLAFIEEDEGAELARNVARHLVTYLQRPGNQAQMSMFTAPAPPDNVLVRRAMAYVAAHLGEDLSAPTLAAEVGVSERHLTRLFLRELDQTPGRYVRATRTEAAANLLVSSSLTMSAIAGRCGFGSAETLRLAFIDRYGVAPSQYRVTQATA